ncbi:MAG: NAD(P)/FAD-dependent oxidoreductase [candidate division WOR-3 bacterium]
MDFDFIVIGAGPIGSYIGKLLAEEGFSVGIFEKKKEIGEEIVCSGIVGEEAFKRFDLPKEAILRSIPSLKIFSPSLIPIEYSRKEPFAFIVDRKVFDTILFKSAIEKGVKGFLESKVINIVKEKNGVSVKCLKRGKEFQKTGRCIILASGTDFSLHYKAGLSLPERLLWGSEVEVKGGSSKAPIEVYVLNKPNLGSFGWVIPLKGYTKIGTLSESPKRESINTMRVKCDGRFSFDFKRVKTSPVVCGFVKKVVADRVIAVGEAAGQVKTTTGGGIYYGLIGASLAKEVLLKAAKMDNFSIKILKDYQKSLKREFGEEIKSGIMVRKLTSKMTSQIIDKFFYFLKENPSIKEELENAFRFDYHKDIITSGIKLFIKEIL